jgi:ribosomal protein L40E
MSFGVDTLGGLTEKLKQLINDTQNLYESFIDANQLYKQGKMGDKEFFIKIGEYLVSTSALNFLAVRVILEIKNAMEKGTSIKSPTGGSSSSPSAPQAGFGIGGFVGTGGTVGPAAAVGGGSSSGNDYTLPLPQEPTFKPVDMDLPKPRANSTTITKKSCVACNASIPAHAKFCSKCGKSQ